MNHMTRITRNPQPEYSYRMKGERIAEAGESKHQEGKGRSHETLQTYFFSPPKKKAVLNNS